MTRVVASNRSGRSARRGGRAPRLSSRPVFRRRLSGEAFDDGRRFARAAARLAPGQVLIAGGETTVTLSDRPGRGGRNLEFALGAAEELRRIARHRRSRGRVRRHRRQLSRGRRVCRRRRRSIGPARSGSIPHRCSGATRHRAALSAAGRSPGHGTHRHQRGRLGLGDEEAADEDRARLCLGLCAFSPARAGVAGGRVARYAIDPAHSTIAWELPATLHTVHGTVPDFSGSVELETGPERRARRREAACRVRAGAMRTGNESRDKNMREKVLEVDRFPEIVFELDRGRDRLVPPLGRQSVRGEGRGPADRARQDASRSRFPSPSSPPPRR